MVKVLNENISKRANGLTATDTEEQLKKLRNKGLLGWIVRPGGSCFSVGIGQNPDYKMEIKKCVNSL